MYIRWLLVGAGFALLQFVLYIGMFLLVQPKYTFFAGNTLLLGSFLAGCLALIYIQYGNLRQPAFFAALNALIIATLLNYALHATVFITVERSISINILEHLSRESPQKYDDIVSNFDYFFVKKDAGLCQRLDEQTYMRNVQPTDRGYLLTPRGKVTLEILQWAKAVTRHTGSDDKFHCVRE